MPCIGWTVMLDGSTHTVEVGHRRSRSSRGLPASFVIAKPDPTGVQSSSRHPEAAMLIRFLLTILLSLSSLTLTATPIAAHGGGLDDFGCHHDRKQGGYHCHRGGLAGQSFASQQDMLAALQKQRPEPVTQAPQTGPRPTEKNGTWTKG